MMRGKVGWTREEEEKLRNYVNIHGPHNWDTMARNLDIGRSGNSCRLKWVNYLKPGIHKGKFTHQEILTITQLRLQGHGWSKIAKKMPGRTDNHIKNFWHSRLRLKKEADQLKMSTTDDDLQELILNKITEPPPSSMAMVVPAAAAADTFVTNCPTGSTDHVSEHPLPTAPQNYNTFDDQSFWADLDSILSETPLIDWN